MYVEFNDGVASWQTNKLNDPVTVLPVANLEE